MLRPGSPLIRPVDDLPGVERASDSLPGVVRGHVSAGRWERIGRGAYVPRASEDESSGPERARRLALARVVGVHRRLSSPHWFSHGSAALLWGLPLWSTPDRTHVLQAHRAGGRNDPAVARHVGVPGESERSTVRGLPVTSLERTLLDCTTTWRAGDALVVADAGLRAGADPGVLAAMLDARTGRRGVARARAVLAVADPGSESPGESMTRLLLLREGLPIPSTQVRVVTRLGTFWGDLGWVEWRVLVEYDGRPKYHQSARDELVREKRRHDAIVEAGWRVVRVTREDLDAPRLAARVARLLPPTAQGARRAALR